MKRLAAIFFLAIILSNAAGFYCYYALKLIAIRDEMRAALKSTPDDQLEVLRLTVPEFESSKVESDEIEVDGKMYDIARIKVSDGYVDVYCLHDAREENLLAFLDAIISAPLPESNDTPEVIIQFLELTYLVPGVEVFPSRETRHDYSIQYCFNVLESPHSIVSPPPELVS